MTYSQYHSEAVKQNQGYFAWLKNKSKELNSEVNPESKLPPIKINPNKVTLTEDEMDRLVSGARAKSLHELISNAAPEVLDRVLK